MDSSQCILAIEKRQMPSIYRMLFDILTHRERQRFFLLLILIIVMAFVDMLGVASILPFLAVVADPDQIRENDYLSWFHAWLGGPEDQSFLIFLGSGVLGMLIISLTVKITTLYVTARFTQMRNYSISGRLLAGYLRQPYAWFLNHHSAQLSRVVLQEVTTLISGSLIPAMRLIAQSLTVVFLLAFLFVINPLVAAGASTIFVGTYAMIFLSFRRKLRRLGDVRLEANRERFKVAGEIFGAAKEVKLLGLEEAYIERFQAPSRRMAESASSAQLIGEMPRYLLEGVAFGSIVVLILVLLVEGDGSVNEVIPTLGVFAFAGLRIFPAVQLMYVSLTTLRTTASTLDSVHREYVDVVDRAALHSGHKRAAAPLRLTDQLELDEIVYHYPLAERAVLAGLSLQVQAKTTVGIVGGTGAGKTTAVDVLLGLLQPQAGVLRVDGTAITEANLRNWQKAVGYVPQQIFLIDDSVSANIAFGIRPEDRDQAAIETAARVANLHDFVLADLPQGYDTHVGERGVRLSGGQRQRIGIARALYHNPEVLILDEATSALDNLTERAVMDAVHALGRQKTIIMIAHRLSTVRSCDRIFLLERGRVSAAGTYEELVAGSEIFRRMAVG
jgi:ABC-type bacteriocin/lantibiotic exporter with double-glycine peptidase domain